MRRMRRMSCLVSMSRFYRMKYKILAKILASKLDYMVRYNKPECIL